MRVEKIWMSPDTAGKSRYALRTLGGIAGIAVLSLLLVWGGTVLIFTLELPRLGSFLVLCLGVTAVAVGLAAAAGRRATGDATVFFLTEEDRLFAMDARRLVYHGRNVLDYGKAAGEVQAFLRHLARRPGVPAGADEVKKVERIKENVRDYALVCQVRHPSGRTVRRTYVLVKGREGEELLLRHLERRESWENALEPGENRGPFRILVSALACAGFAALCALSHPAVALLPGLWYYPCLAAGFAALCGLVWFALRQRRGE